MTPEMMEGVQGMMDGGMWEMMDPGFWGPTMMVVGAVLSLAVTLLMVVALVLLVVWLWRKVREPAPRGAAGPQASGEAALEILRRRYARGELSDDEFQRMRTRLEEDR